MVGHPKVILRDHLDLHWLTHGQHVHKACALGADLICAQGTEAGGHTGDIPTR